MIRIGDKVRLIKTGCENCSVCKEAMSGYFEVEDVERGEITLDLPQSGICRFDGIFCGFELMPANLENK